MKESDQSDHIIKPAIGIACGGTGGHIFPGLATAKALQKRGYPVILWLAGKDVEKIALEGWQGSFYKMETRPVISKNVFKMLGAFLKMLKAFFACRCSMQKERIKVLLAMGSYASIPPALAAKSLGIRLVLHEANAVPGRAVKFLSRISDCVALSFEEAINYFPASIHTELTGMPIRTLCKAVESDSSGVKESDFTLLIMGGSRGAASLNRIVPEAISMLYRNGLRLKIMHIAGIEDAENVKKRYKELVPELAVEVISFTHHMEELYSRATLAICRSGASTCAELIEFGVPSILIPYPYATNQHQLVNARIMENKGFAVCLVEQGLVPEKLAELIRNFMIEKDKLELMRKKALTHRRGNATEKLADLVERYLK